MLLRCSFICIVIVWCLIKPLHAASEDLRQRLTEREDKRRPSEPWGTLVAGRPLTASGGLEISLESLRLQGFGNGSDQRNRLLLQQNFEAEAFYSFGPPLSIFAQLRAERDNVYVAGAQDETATPFLERGEMWLSSQGIAGSRINLDLGRLHFEDDRRWWWDEDLDAIRVTYERPRFEIAVALARELAPNRTDHHFVAPEHDGIIRLIGEMSLDFRPNHALNLFLLHHRDRSGSEQVGQPTPRERDDLSDGTLTWLGARMMGAFDFRPHVVVGYWFDTAWVRGRERVARYEEISPRLSAVNQVSDRIVRGHAVDLGVTLMLPVSRKPRLYAGYALGSGDRSRDSVDHSFRQSGIQANEPGFGGVRRFPQYGVLLQPELSNLKILTFGAGLSLLGSSSLDLVYHHFRLAEFAQSLRAAKLDAALTGDHRDVGAELDLILALEEWKRVEVELSAGTFRAGRAFGDGEGRRSYRGFFSVRIAF